jgi:protein-S-isoprenylcysteine O-methyltransferase Ste14
MASLRRNASSPFCLFSSADLEPPHQSAAVDHPIPHSAWEPWWQILLAAALIAVGITSALESVRRFIFVSMGTLVPVAPPQHLVVSGFYQYVRNPMYVGVLVALSGEATLFWSRGIVIDALHACLGFNLFIRMHEEPSLNRHYPDEYPRYKSQVPRWFPRSLPGTNAKPDLRNPSRSHSVQLQGACKCTLEIELPRFGMP